MPTRVVHKMKKGAAIEAENNTMTQCDGCGLPPRPGQELLCCSRCEGAWYHDENCQRDHFSAHKGGCREARTCHGCGLPARPGETLVYCSKCDAACYHGKECQLKHFPEHQVECAKIAKRNANFRVAEGDGATARELMASYDNTPGDPPLRLPFVKMEQRDFLEGGGWRVVANKDIPTGAHPLQSFICKEKDCPGDHGWMEAFVPPVLDNAHRRGCCSFCFAALPGGAPMRSRAECFYCSIDCQEKDFNGPLEVRASKEVLRRGEALPDARVVLMSRVMRYSKKFPEVKMELAFIGLAGGTSYRAYEYDMDVAKSLRDCHRYLKYFEGSIGQKSAKWLEKNPYSAPQGDMRWASNFLRSVREISAENTGGLGIFPQILSIKHSCKPNAVVSLFFRKNDFPVAQVTTLTPVADGVELTIDYTDKASDNEARRFTAERQAYLLDNYKFKCTCSLCLDYETDDMMMGFVCPSRDCVGTVRSRPEDTDDDDDIPPRKYTCDTCGHRNFNKQARWQKSIVKKAHRETASAHLLECYELAKKDFQPQSRIVATLAAQFVSSCARTSSEGSVVSLDEDLGRDGCRRICEMMEYSRAGMQICFEGRAAWPYLKMIEAQARRHLNPDDSVALNDLHLARKEMGMFLPETMQCRLKPNAFGMIHVPKCHHKASF